MIHEARFDVEFVEGIDEGCDEEDERRTTVRYKCIVTHTFFPPLYASLISVENRIHQVKDQIIIFNIY